MSPDPRPRPGRKPTGRGGLAAHVRAPRSTGGASVKGRAGKPDRGSGFGVSANLSSPWPETKAAPVFGSLATMSLVHGPLLIGMK